MMKKKSSYTAYMFLLGIIALLVVVWGCRAQEKKEVEVKKIIISGKVLYAEIADTSELRARGLQFRETLLDNWGMLFVYDKEQSLRFWMKDTLIPLDIAFIDKTGVIKEIYQGIPRDETIIQSQEKAKYALEVNQNWFRRNGLDVGDAIRDL